MYWPVFDPIYYLFALPALILGMIAQARVRSAYTKYSKVRNLRNISGQEAAQVLLRTAGLESAGLGDQQQGVGVALTSGTLSDNYNPRDKKLYLSRDVAQVPSVASLGIVAHEIGHAMQDSQGYVPLKLRSAIVPAVKVGSWLGPLLFIVGMLFASSNLSLVGLVLFSLTLVFALVTLPVEFDASRRAMVLLQQSGLTTVEEQAQVKKVLSAAAMTYVAAAVQALSTLLYYMTLLNRRRD